MKITKTRLKKLINEELRASDYDQQSVPAKKALVERVYKETGVDTLSVKTVISYLSKQDLIKENGVAIRSEKLIEDLEMGISAAGSAVDIRAKRRAKPELEPPGLQDPHSSGYNSDPDAIINNVQMASRVLEELPLEDLPESVSNAAQMLRQALDELYGSNPNAAPGEPAQNEPPYFRPSR